MIKFMNISHAFFIIKIIYYLMYVYDKVLVYAMLIKFKLPFLQSNDIFILKFLLKRVV